MCPIPLTKQCIPTVDARLKQIEYVQLKVTKCLQEEKEIVRIKFHNMADKKPRWKVVHQVETMLLWDGIFKNSA